MTLNRPVHPGLILADELADLGITPTRLARDIAVPPNRITQILAGQRGITGDTALRLGHWFKMSPQFWQNLQSQYELAVAAQAVGESVKALPTREAA
ncbi:MAG: HigA family addiction module antitoxin [Hyphomonadaceae bacterium]|jgi:addiction module HigA family antidote|nr:HigA family addiction module antitoxin [Hyphomonadaceae bacterium]